MSRKGENLVVLAANGVTTPRGFMLGAEHYAVAVAKHLDTIEAAVDDPALILEIFEAMELSPATVDLLEVELGKLDGVERFAVRSSGNVISRGTAVDEDSAQTALAGQFDSFLQVPRDAVGVAVRRCWASLFNSRSMATFGIDHGYVANSTMSVVIQEMVVADASAVMMTVDPLGDGTTGSIDMTIGPCEALVAGLVSPDEVTFERDSGSVVGTVIGPKERRVVYDDFSTGDNTHLVANPPTVSARLSLDDDTTRRIIEVGCRIEQIFGCPQDVEIVVTHSGGIVVTQARPVTTLPAVVTPFTNTSSDNVPMDADQQRSTPT